MASLSQIPNRAARTAPAAAAATAETATAAAATAATLPPGVRVERRARRGLVLVASRAFAAGEIVLQEAPLAVLPPFDPSAQWAASTETAGVNRSSSSSSRHSSGGSGGWPAVESLVRSLGFRDDALLLYRAVLLYYLLFLSGEGRAQAQRSHACAQRILALYDPARGNDQRPKADRADELEGEDAVEEVSTTPSSDRGPGGRGARRQRRARRAEQQESLSAAVGSEAGRAALAELFACVAAQAARSMGVVPVHVPVALSSSSSSSGGAASPVSFDHGHFLSHALAFAAVYNVNNMDCVVALSDSSGGAEVGSGPGCTGVYDALSRLNHSCLPRCVHFLEHEQPAQWSADFGASLTPQKLAAAVTTPADTSTGVPAAAAASASPSSSAPLVRTLRALCPIAAGDELTISYLSPQLLCQSTQQRQAQLRQHWNFTCRCARCQAVDTARVLRCPSCANGSVLVRPEPLSSSATAATASAAQGTEGDDAEADEDDDSEPPFTLASTCGCAVEGSAAAALLRDESAVEAEWARFQAALPSCTQPVELSALFSTLLQRNRIGDSHWLSFEFGLVQRDLARVLHRPVDEMEQQKRAVWFLERVGSRALVRDAADVARLPRRYAVYRHDSLLIDCESPSFVSPASRVASLCASTELLDGWSDLAEVLWAIHPDKSAELQRMLVQRAIYFTLCAARAARALTPADPRRGARARLDAKLRQRVAIARAKLVDLSRLVEEDGEADGFALAAAAAPLSGLGPAPAAPAVAGASPALRCHSPVCPSNSFSAAPPVAALICTRCRLVRYCSPACQRVDWKLHKPTCKAKK